IDSHAVIHVAQGAVRGALRVFPRNAASPQRLPSVRAFCQPLVRNASKFFAMGATERFTRREFQRILDVTDKQLAYWEKLGLVTPRESRDGKFYDFRDLISLRTA